MWTSEKRCRQDHLMTTHNMYTYDDAAHYLQTSSASFYASPWQFTACGYIDATHVPLAAPSNTFPAMHGTMSDEMSTRPIERKWYYIAEDFGQLRKIYGHPLDIAVALDPCPRAATTTNPTTIAAPPSLASALDDNGIAWQVVEQVVRCNRIRLTAHDAGFIYLQKFHKTVHMAAAKLGEE